MILVEFSIALYITFLRVFAQTPSFFQPLCVKDLFKQDQHKYPSQKHAACVIRCGDSLFRKPHLPLSPVAIVFCLACQTDHKCNDFVGFKQIYLCLSSSSDAAEKLSQWNPIGQAQTFTRTFLMQQQQTAVWKILHRSV